MGEIWAYLLGLLPTILSGAALYYIQRRQKKRDETESERAEARKTENKIIIDLQMATAKLSYATAIALKRGRANGEVEDGVEEYEKALEEFREFERDQISRL